MPFAEIDGIDMYYETYGEGVPVVLLHGGFGDGRLWAELAKPLDNSYRIVVPDLRGHGRTGGSNRESYSIDLFANDVRELTTALSLDAPVVCGRSLGGFIALVYADRHPDVCSGMITLGGEAPETLTTAERIEQYRPTLVNLLSRVVDRERVQELLYRFDLWRYGERGMGDMSAIERVHKRHGREVPEQSESERRKVEDAITSYLDLVVDYESIHVPSLHLYGEYEIPRLHRHARYMADRIPHGEAREIPNAGHVSHVDNPEFVVDAIREFLNGKLAK